MCCISIFQKTLIINVDCYKKIILGTSERIKFLALSNPKRYADPLHSERGQIGIMFQIVAQCSEA